MPIENGDYVPLSSDEVFDNLVTEFENTFDSTVEPGDVIRHQLRALADVIAANQEQSLQEVYRSAYLADASGENLSKLVEPFGLERMEAVGATGVVEFATDTLPTSTVTIPNGTIVMTAGDDPIEYETTEVAFLRYIDGFEDGDLSEWSGDTASFSVTTHSSATGTNALQIPASSGVTVVRDEPTIRVGTTAVFDYYPEANTTKTFQFGRQDSSNYYEATIDANNGELVLDVVDGGSSATSSTTSVTIPTGEAHYVEVEWGIGGTLTLRLYESDATDTQIGSVSVTDSEKRFLDGTIAFSSQDANGSAYVDEIGTTVVTANVEGVDTGVETNVGPDTVTEWPSPVAGVDSLTNPLPLGDDAHSDTNGVDFSIGSDEETDAELKDRTRASTSIGGSATPTAVASAVQQLDGVQSVTIYTNPTDTDNTGSGGLPPYSFEVAVHGGTTEEIAEAIFDTAGVTARDYGGAHGTEVTHDVESDVLPATETISISRPTEVTLDIDVDLIHDESYVGADEIRSRVVEYIGGTDTDGGPVNGLGVDEDVYVEVLKDAIVGPSDTGVYDADLTIDSTGDDTDDTTTSANGAEILDVGVDEVAVTDASDGSITVTETSK